MRVWWPLMALAATACQAQTPDVVPRIDLRATMNLAPNGEGSLRWYDPMGRYSVVGLGMILEPGIHVLVTERLQRIRGDSDEEQLDEYFVEDPRNWRVGKQYLPFGARVLFRQAAPALRLDTSLLINSLPIAIALADAGPGRTRGVIGRIGGARAGVSFAFGNHFGSSSTSLTPLRRPEDAPGRGGGYATAVGFDYNMQVGEILVGLEALALREPSTALEDDDDITDVLATYRFGSGDDYVSLGWARGWRTSRDAVRFEAQIGIAKGLALMPFVRTTRRAWPEIGLTARIKL